MSDLDEMLRVPETEEQDAPTENVPDPVVEFSGKPAAERKPLNWKAALIGAAVGMLLAGLLLWIGFWKTLLVVLFGSAGAFIAGVDDKVQAIKDFLNRVFPPRN